MITYFEELSQQEQQELTETIQLLFQQTFLLERKYDRRTKRMQFQKQYRICYKHFSFLKQYFALAGMTLLENSPSGVIYLRGEKVLAEKLSKLTTVYLLVLKVLYDEQMEAASNSDQIHTTLSELNERVGSFGILDNRPTMTEIKRTLSLLRRYQIVDLYESLEVLQPDSRLLIYPSINLVLYSEDAQNYLDGLADREEYGLFSNEETEDDDLEEDDEEEELEEMQIEEEEKGAAVDEETGNQ
ncbi:MAG: DUF4194 domain-containing protein [Lachnospiraceae bacterium]